MSNDSHLSSFDDDSNDTALNRRRKDSKNVPGFIMKLFKMVTESPLHLIRWTDDGEAFVITSPEDFSKDVLPRFFRHNNISSFVRQLNMYGFHKLPNPSCDNFWEFIHPSFKKGRPELLYDLKRKSHKDNNEKEVDIMSILNELSSIRQQQREITSDLNLLQRNHQLLLHEVISARDQYIKQQDTIDKLLRFLASIFSKNISTSDGILAKKPRLLIEDKDTLGMLNFNFQGLLRKKSKNC